MIRTKLEAYELLDAGDARRTDIQKYLLFDLQRRYELSGELCDLDRMIGLLMEAPSEDPDYGIALLDLAAALSIRYNRTGAHDDLDTMTKSLTEALELHPHDHPLHGTTLDSLAGVSGKRYDRTGQLQHLERMVELLEKALESHPPCHHLHGRSLNNLAYTLRRRYERLGSLDDIERRIVLLTEAVKLHPPKCPSRDESMDSLAVALGHRYKHIGTPDDLDRMIGLLTEVLDLRPAGHTYYDNALNNLGMAIGLRYDRTGAEDDLTASIRLHRDALSFRPPGHPRRDSSLTNLALALDHRYGHTGAEDDLRESIRLCTEALALCPPGHPGRDTPLNNFATVLTHRYTRTGSQDHLEESIRLLEEALELRSFGHPLRSSTLNNLAIALSERYDCTGKQNDLERAIELHKEALVLRPHSHPFHDSTLNNLAVVLLIRYDRTGAPTDIEQPIWLLEEALELRSPGHPHRVTSLCNLADAIGRRHNCTNSSDDIERRIGLFTEVLELLPSDHPDRGNALGGLANTLGDRHNQSHAQNDLNAMVLHFASALELHTVGHPSHGRSSFNLGSALARRYLHTRSQDDLKEAIRLHRVSRAEYTSGHPRHATVLIQLANVLWLSESSSSEMEEVFQLLREGSVDRVSPLGESLRCAHAWVHKARQMHHGSLGDAYDHLIQCLRHYLIIGPTIKLQYNALVAQANLLSFPMDAASHAIANGDVERAVELLDAGRSLLWSEMRRFREPLLRPELVGDDLATKFESVRSELQNISSAEARFDTVWGGGQRTDRAERDASIADISYDILLPRKRKLLDDYEELLGLIRKRPGFEDFLGLPPFKKLREAAREGPVIIVNASEFGSHIVIVPNNSSKQPSLISLGEGTKEKSFYKAAFEMHGQYLEARQEMTLNNSQDRSKAFGHKLMPVLQKMWRLVVSKVVTELKAGAPKWSRIWWCPTSFLTILPFHAAGTGKRFLIDSYISSYTPTLKTLIDARQSSPSSAAAAAVDRSEPHPRILVVAQTEPGPEFLKLAALEEEVDIMRHLGSFVQCLEAQEATRPLVVENLRSHNWAHFICHGTVSPSPFESSMHLYGGDTLSLNDIIKAQLPDAQFAFLAACHTAEQSDIGLQDEILHLAAAMQFSGFRGVVGTMWAMKDRDGPSMAEKFYSEMLRDGYRTRAARALGPLGRLIAFVAKRFYRETSRGDVSAAERHKRAARAMWKVTRAMKKEGVALERWMNFVHIGA